MLIKIKELHTGYP